MRLTRMVERLRTAVRRRTRDAAPARLLRFQLVGERLDLLGGTPRRILDAGCGEAFLAERIARRHPDWTVVGIDLHRELLDRGRRRLEHERVVNVDLREHDLTQPLESCAYDAVVAIECLEEIVDDEAALRVLADAVRPGGSLLVHVPERDWTPALGGSERVWRHEVRHGYDADELAGRISRLGLHVVEVRPTSRGVVRVAQELVDRARVRSPRLLAVIYPLVAAVVALERHGLTWGSARAVFIRAERPRRAEAVAAEGDGSSGAAP